MRGNTIYKVTEPTFRPTLAKGIPLGKSLPIPLEKHQLDKEGLFKLFINIAKSHPFLVPCFCGIGACPAADGKGPGDGSKWIVL
jgi:hypothetical protein